MTLSAHRNLLRWIIITSSFIIISLILWNTYVFFQNFKEEERSKMKNWSFAQKEANSTGNLTENISGLPLQILSSNKTTPIITIDHYGKIDHRNIDEEKAKDSLYLMTLVEKFKKENNPIPIKYKDKVLTTLYYGNSPLINRLKYYPLALLLIIILFATVVYLFYKSSKNADQNKLWTGMAKETAHQIGTPLSSLIGWTEILKTENVNPEYIVEIEKDVDRLQTITERFSKIGSKPTLVKTDIIKATKNSYNYLKVRSSKLIMFEIVSPKTEIFVDLNEQLFSWTIENLVKNAIDAMKGKGNLNLEISRTERFVFINVSDTGKGLVKNQFNRIFEPGFTTKKRGWGLGLSLAKRIIEDYHNGRIKVLNSDIGKGTTLQISLKIVD
ncbi:MAG: HAMP domain-containing sensor histidine kinase [Winogradskyella sp.]